MTHHTDTKGTHTMAARNTRKVLATVLALGAATGAIVFGSFAAWTATTNNNGNSVTTGTMTFTNSRPSDAAIISVTGAKPGDTGTETVTLTNSGSTAMSSIQFRQTGTPTNTVGTDLKLKITDSNGYCVWPDKAAGPCSGYGAWTHADLTTGVTVPGTLAAAASRTFTFDWQFDTAAGNATQGKSASFDATWTGNQ